MVYQHVWGYGESKRRPGCNCMDQKGTDELQKTSLEPLTFALGYLPEFGPDSESQ
jgi:hypothetical protein